MGEDSQEPQDSHLPRHERQFPFRAQNEAERAEVRADISAALCGVENMIYQLILGRMRRREKRDRDLIEEFAQSIRVHLAIYSLPRYDRLRGIKVSTFLHACISNAANEEIRRHRRPRRNRAFEPLNPDSLVARDESVDRAVEALALRVINDPAHFFTFAEARAFQAVNDAGPDVERREVARNLGYAGATSLSLLLQRARKAVLNLDIYDAPTKPMRPLASIGISTSEADAGVDMDSQGSGVR